MKKWLVATALVALGCYSDPLDPKTWIKQLDNPRDQKEAVRQLVKLKDKRALGPLIDLYKRSSDPEHLKAIASFDDVSSVPVLVDSLDYSQESCDRASIAATALGDIGEKSAVEALIKAVLKPLPIKTRCNIVKLEGMKSLARIKDPRAVDALIKVLSTSADEQDFFLNKVAAKSLGDFADPKAVPVLVRGLFMTGRGANIFQECRAALIAIGEPAVDKLIETLQRKNGEVEDDAKKYEFVPGIIAQKASRLLGDLRSKHAIQALREELAKKDDGLLAGEGKGVSAHQSIILALGLLGGPDEVKLLAGILNDPKRHLKERSSAAEALNALGDLSVLPSLAKIAQTKFLKGTEIDGEVAQLVAAAATAYSRLADAEHANVTYPKLDPELAQMVEVFGAATDRLAVAKECKSDVACYGRFVAGPAKFKAEKAALMLSRLGKPGLSELTKHVGVTDPATRMAVLFGIGHLGDKTCAECKASVEKQLTQDENKPPLKGLYDEMRAVRAQLMH